MPIRSWSAFTSGHEIVAPKYLKGAAKGFHATVHDTDDVSANAVVRSDMLAVLST